MRTPKEFTVRNFRLGQRRDGALRDDRLWSMRTLRNLDVDYEEGRLHLRPGYVRWNDTALPAVADQLFDFVDLSGNQHLLGICNSRWYEFKETGAHVLLIDEAASAPRPIFSVEDRVFLATDSGFYWTDHSVIGTADRVYRVGIDMPAAAPTVTLAASQGNVAGVVFPNPAQPFWDLNNTTRKKVAAKFTLASETTLQGLMISFMWYQLATKTGEIRAAVYSDLAGVPDQPFDDHSISAWIPLTAYTVAVYHSEVMRFSEEVTFPADDYWIVVEASSDYYSNFYGGLPPESQFWVALAYSTPAPAGQAKRMSGAAWVDSTNLLGYGLGGMDPDVYYDYKLTYRNSTYRSESRPSTPSERIKATFAFNRAQLTFPASGDAQVDKVGIFRREIGTDGSLIESAITTDFKQVAEVDDTSSPYTERSAVGGAVLDSEDHYALRHTDEGDEGLRPTAVVPDCGCYWNDRVWVSDGSNNVWFSKIFERDNASGLVNDPTEDYFPLKNKLNIPLASGVIALEEMSDSQLMVYFRNEMVYMIWGAYEPLNPPTDINLRDVLRTGGLFAPRGVDRTSTRHAIMTADGLWAFSGSAGLPELLSETNQSIFKAIQNTYLENTRVVVFGTEIWVLHDPDNDGVLEDVLILDMMRDVPSRQIYDRPWRTYTYNVPLKDLVVRQTGSDYKHILAADGTNAYILRLGTGTTDNGNAIVASVETHNIQARNLVMLSGIELEGSYPATPPTYRIYGYGSDGSVKTYDLTPTSDQDIRRHRTGMQVMAVGDARIKIEMTSTQADELKSFLLKYVTE